MATAQVDYDVPFEDITDTTVSKLAPYSVLIFAVALSCTFLFRLYFLEMFLLPKAHPAYKTFTENERRSFVTHYLSACIKVLLLIFAIYPTIMLTWVRHAEPYTPFGGSKVVTIGDMLLVCSQVFCSMIVHELFFKKKVSPITAAHHLGALVTAQTAVILTVAGEEDGVYQFILAFIWGAFDVIAELWPHLSVITYRLNPGKHGFLTKVFLYTCIIQVASTIIQTGLILWVFISLWDKWTIGLKISTPILHVLFSAAQLYGAWFTYRLYKKQAKLAATAVSDSEGGSQTVDEGKVDQFPKEAETAVKEA